MDYQGSCHCGTVKFEFSSDEVKEGLRCNCSICRRKGAVMLPKALSSEQLKIDDIGSDALRSYKFGSEVAEHFFCEKCGIYTFHETKREPGKFRVNLGCIEGIDVFELDVKVFDGASL